MIGQLNGKVSFLNSHFAIVNVAGIGYKVFFKKDDLLQIKENDDLFIWTHLAVREDALDLYGFLDKENLDYFELLISISGIGPKGALSILSLAPPETLRQAVLSGNTGYLTKVSGIGRKRAEKIILELKDKLETNGEDGSEISENSGDVIDALLALGFSNKDCREVLKKISPELGTDEKIKEALRIIGQK